jgi:hypothetical protein
VTFIEQTKNTHGVLVEMIEVKRLLRNLDAEGGIIVR